MFESPVIQISILSLILVTAVLIYLIRSEIVQNKIFDLNSIGYKLFFYRNMLTGEEHISYSLKKLLQLKDSNNNIDSLLSFFIKKDQELLSQIYNDLADPNKSYNSIFVSDTDIAIKLELNDYKDVSHLSCQYLVLRDQTGFAHGFFLFFGNITADMEMFNHLNVENEELKADIVSKNNILNSLPVPIWMRDENLKVCYFNNKFSQIISYQEGEQDNPNLLELDNQSISLAVIAKNTNLEQKEERHIIVDGQRCLYQIYEIPVPNLDIIVGMGYDMTSKELVKSELERHISAQSDLLESTASATAIYGADMKLQFFNQAFVRLWDLNEHWLVTNPTYAQILEKLREKRKLPEQADFQKFKSEQIKLFTDIISPYNEFFYLPNGTYLRVIVIQHALGGLLFSYEDMTDKLQLERSIRTLSAVQKETIDNLNEGITVFGENGKLELSNPKYMSMWKQDKEFVSLQPHISDVLEVMYKSCDHRMKLVEFKDIFLSKISARVTAEISLVLKDDSVIDLLFVPLPDGGTLISYHDVTDTMTVERSLREKNMALQDADRIKTEFLANVSYELRSPLTSIIGFSEMLEREYYGGLNKQQTEYIEAIHNSSHYLMMLINDILDLASIDAGYMKLELSKFDIFQVIQSIRPLVQERIKEEKLSFEIICEPNIGGMLGDEKRVKQVLFKLLSNSIENSFENGIVKLTASKTGPATINFIIEDNGIGMDEEEVLHAFDKFYNISSKKKAKKIGGGLGLALVKSFVELHGGKIIVESSKNKGSKFNCIFQIEHPELLAIYNEENNNEKKL